MAAAKRRETEVLNNLRHAGVDTLSLSTEDDLVRAIAGFAGRRKQFGRSGVRAV